MAELRWDFERGTLRNGFKYVRVELDSNRVRLKISGQKETENINFKDNDRTEMAIVEAVFNPAYRPPINGPHPENQ